MGKEKMMSNSSLVKHTRISPNRTSPRNHTIDTITIHCVVGQCSVETLGDIFAPTSRQASCNYGVGVDGRIGMYCEEKDRSWCTSSSSNDNRAITIEVASDASHPYAVKDIVFASLLDLITDICKRNNIKELKWKADKSLIGQVDKQNMTVHRWFANKSCPGDYLYNLHPAIVAEVNKRLNAAITPPAPASDGTIKVGDIVSFKGGNVYSSASASSAAATKPASKCKVTSVYNGKHPYHCISEDGKGVYGWVDASSIETAAAQPTSFQVQVTIDELNIRKGPGTNYAVAGSIKDKGVYTIVETNGDWGKLKSGAGWIHLGYTKKL
jgi:hypothetical protein